MRRLIFISLILLCLFLPLVVVHAEVKINFSFPCSSGFGDCPDQSTIPGYIVRLYQFGLGISGILGVGMIVVGGILYATSVGKPDKQGEAKDMITSALWGILLLFGAYIILNTINPRLVQLGEPTVKQATSTVSQVGNGDSSYKNPDEVVMILAQKLLETGIDLSSYASCMMYSDPQSIVGVVSAGYYPFVCSSGCNEQSGCWAGGEDGSTSLSKYLLSELIRIQEDKIRGDMPNFTVISLTGGIHDPNSRHYQGTAADLIVQGNGEDWNRALERVQAYYVWAKCEYKNAENEVVFTENCEDMFSDSKNSNKHIHMHITR